VFELMKLFYLLAVPPRVVLDNPLPTTVPWGGGGSHTNGKEIA
jgi:hypothetical protein